MYYVNQCWEALPSRNAIYDSVASALSAGSGYVSAAGSYVWENPKTVAKYLGLTAIAVSSSFSSAVYFGIWSFVCARVINEKAFDAKVGGPSPFQDSPNTMIITIATLLKFIGSPLGANFFSQEGHEKAKKTIEKFQCAFGTLGYVFYLRNSFNISKDMRWALALLSLPAFIVLFFSLIGLALTRQNLQSYHDKMTHFFKTKWGQRVGGAGKVTETIAEAIDTGTLWTAGVVGFIEYFVSGRSLVSPVSLTNTLAIVSFVVGSVFSIASSAYDAWKGKAHDEASHFKKIIKILTNTFALIFAWLEFFGTYMIVAKPKIEIGTARQSVSAFEYLAQYTDPFAGLLIACSCASSWAGVYLPRIIAPTSYQSFWSYISSMLHLNTLSLEVAKKQWADLYAWANGQASAHSASSQRDNTLTERLLADETPV